MGFKNTSDPRPRIGVEQLIVGVPASIRWIASGNHEITAHGQVSEIGPTSLRLVCVRRTGHAPVVIGLAAIEEIRLGDAEGHLVVAGLRIGQRVRIRRYGSDYLGRILDLGRTRALVEFDTARRGTKRMWVPATELVSYADLD